MTRLAASNTTGGAPPPGPDLPPLDPAVADALAERGDWVSSWWTAGVLAALTVGFLAFAVIRRRRAGSGARRRTWYLWLAASVCLVVGTGIGINAYVGYLPDVKAVTQELGLDTGDVAGVAPREAVTRDAQSKVSSLGSPLPTGSGSSGVVDIPRPDTLGMPDPPADTWVYTPPGYDPSGTTLYPVVYLHHGDPGNSSNWFESGIADVVDALITTGALRPVIVVGPDTNAVDVGESDCLDSDHGGSQVESYLTEVVVPWIDDHYPVAPGYAYRAIGGMSSGAFCAVDQGLRHPELYGTILGIMPFAAPGTEQIEDETAREAHVVTSYVPVMTFPHPVYVYATAGGDDPQSAADAQAIVAALQARQQPAVVEIVPGEQHTWNFTMSKIPEAMQYWERAMQELERAGDTALP